MIRLLRLHMKNSNANPRTHLVLETLAEAAFSLENPEVAHYIADIPNIMQVEEVPKGQE